MVVQAHTTILEIEHRDPERAGHGHRTGATELSGLTAECTRLVEVAAVVGEAHHAMQRRVTHPQSAERIDREAGRLRETR